MPRNALPDAAPEQPVDDSEPTATFACATQIPLQNPLFLFFIFMFTKHEKYCW
jgi:hypothetical protein